MGFYLNRKYTKMSLFYCKTENTIIFKYLFDMLFHNMSTVPISISQEGFAIFVETINNYIFNIFFPKELFQEWEYNGEEPLYFGLGSINSQDFKEFTSKSFVEMRIHKRQSQVDPIVLKMKITSSVRKFVKQFTMFSEEIPFTESKHIVKGPMEFSLPTQDFTSLCKGFKTGVVNMICSDEGISIVSKLEGVREKAFIFPEYVGGDIDISFSADKLLNILKMAMCVNKKMVFNISQEAITVYGDSHLGSIEVQFLI